MKSNIRVDKFAITGGPNQFGSVIPAIDYRIPAKNIWILGSNPQTVDCGKNVLERGLCH